MLKQWIQIWMQWCIVHHKNWKLELRSSICYLCMTLIVGTYALAKADAIYTLPDGSAFDAEYYASQNPDVVASVGNDPEALMDHYWNYGIPEGRLPMLTPFTVANNVSVDRVIFFVNNYRQEIGLNTLTFDSALANAAQIRARELADNQLFSHTRPDGSKWNTALGANVGNYKVMGENLGRGQSSAMSVVQAWKASPAHQAILANGRVTKIGVGVAKSTDGKFYFCLIVAD